MLQQRPNSADRFSPSPSHHHHNSRSSPKYGSTSSTGYRGVPPSGPVAPYAFTSTPQLGSNSSPHRSQPSSPPLATSTAPQLPQLNLGGISGDMSLSNSTTSKSMPPSPSASNFQTVIKPSENMNRTDSSQSLSTPSRYRNIRRTDTGDSGTPKPHGSAMPSGSGMAAVGQLYNHPSQSSSTPSLNSNSSYRGTQYGSAQPSKPSNDEMQVGRQQEKDQASRYRRRSINNIETAGLTHASNDPNDKPTPHPNTFVHHQQQRPISAHKHTGSSESAASAVSGPSSRPGSARQESMTTSPQHGHAAQMGHIAKQDVRMVNVPQRHNDNNRRIPSGVATPSPLSRPMSPSAEDDTTTALPPKPKASPAPAPTAAPALSPAAAHLAALDQKEAKKSKSKLRRAFSFGSAAELRKVTAQANLEKSNATTTTSKRISRHEEELDPESARVAAKQEAAGLGESIYSGQGNFFTGSTDNLSISSTASSASIMLRKMGKGMKKGGRSLVGLFRPKSVVGVPAADGPVNQASAAQVSMMTVEAEREKVNVNLDPHAHQGGGTGFPKLERNSIDNKMSLDSGTASTDTRSRRSIVGGERERAEVLAAVKKGILKRNGSNQASPTLRPNDSRAPELTLPNIPHVNDSPRSSAPSTPKDEPLPVGHKRTDSVTINDPHDDYFGSGSRFTSLDSNTGQPITPNRNISFSPRIQFYDTWTSGEYDRRGEIATCNRLTPMLAQQIKEELNSFKMEMEVAESSKVYTHFF